MSNPNSVQNILLKKKDADGSNTNNSISSSGSNGGGKLSMRRLFQQKKELEEKRRYGLAPLAQDTVTHQEISTNVPSAMTEAPWYYGIEGPTLAHQRAGDGSGDGHQSEQLVYQPDELKDLGKATAYVAGACKNCGSRTHKTKDCIYANKKVGAVFSGVVSGADWELVGQGDKAAAAKQIAAFDGDVGVDLMKSVDAERLAGPTAQKRPALAVEGGEVEVEGEKDKKRVKADLFGGKTAQHGGLEIKEVPKYLQNLELDGSGGSGVYFDPKTGSMRGNPNAQDMTKEFQGDLARYRAGDYHHYVEAQHRFLTGQSKSFVNFALDEEIGKEKAMTAERRLQPASRTTTTEPATGTTTATTASAVTTTQEAILEKLYKRSSAATTTTTTSASSINPSSSLVDKVPLPFPRTGASGSGATHSEVSLAKKALAEVEDMQRQATKNNHLFPFGSYFDVKTFSWGYKCCQRCGRDAPFCVDE